MGNALLRNARDAYVGEAAPAKNYSRTARMYIAGSGAANTRYVYLFFSRPFPLGVTILDAHLRVWNGGAAWAGTVNMSAKRIGAKWGINRINWNNKPATTGTAVTVTKTGAPVNTMWDFNLTSMMQLVSSGGVWFGIRLEVDVATAGRWLYSTEAREEYRPVLEVTWSDAPEPPEDLSPAGNRSTSLAKPTLTFDFTDVSGDTDLAAIEVQIAPTEAELGGGTQWTSGEKLTSDPELDLATTTYPGLAAGATAWWRVRVKDGAGIWSSWSQNARFRRDAKGTPALQNPAASPNNVIEDPTPPIAWSLTGATQSAYQVIISKAGATQDWLWTSRKITSTDTSMSIPKGVIKSLTDTYNVTVRLWDTVNREKTPGDPVYVEVSRDFTYRYDATVDPVSNLVMTEDYPYPWAVLTFSRAIGMPDSFTIVRDGEVVESDINPQDLLVSGVNFKYLDRLAPARVDHEWKVLAIVNGKSSNNNPAVTGSTRPITSWLMETDSSDPIALFNPNISAELATSTERHDPVGDNSPVLITQSTHGGFEGQVQGRLVGGVVPGLTAQAQKARYKRLKKNPGKKLTLFNLDETMTVVIYNATYRPVKGEPGTIEYIVEFNYIQVD